MIADGGLKIDSRVYTANAAAAVLLVVDNPEAAAGKRYSVADENAFTMRQRIEFIARHMGAELELVDMPYELAWPCHPLWRHVRGHRLAMSTLIREELGYREPVAAGRGDGEDDRLAAREPARAGRRDRAPGRRPVRLRRARTSSSRAGGRRATAFGPAESPLPEQGHQYRHPKKPGEAWSAGPGRRASRERRAAGGAAGRASASSTSRPRWPGPTASMLLADFGADVLKVEPPEGESSRRWGSARFGPGGGHERPLPRAQPQQARRSRSTSSRRRARPRSSASCARPTS